MFFDLHVRFRLIKVERKGNEFMLVPNDLVLLSHHCHTAASLIIQVWGTIYSPQIPFY